MPQPQLSEYQLVEQILSDIKEIQNNQADQYTAIMRAFGLLRSATEAGFRTIGNALEALASAQQNQTTILNQVLAAVNPPLPVQTSITLSSNQTGDTLMDPKHPKATAGLDLQINDDGKGGTATLNFADSVGNVAPIPAGATISGQTWTPSNPALTITPDPSGLFATFVPTSNAGGPPALATGITITVSNMTLTLSTGATSTITGSTAAQAVDVIADTPTSSSVQLSAN